MVRNKEPAFAGAARVVELADTPDLGSGSVRIGGSSPLARTIFVLSGFSSQINVDEHSGKPKRFATAMNEVVHDTYYPKGGWIQASLRTGFLLKTL
jgi:hypothetical protein